MFSVKKNAKIVRKNPIKNLNRKILPGNKSTWNAAAGCQYSRCRYRSFLYKFIIHVSHISFPYKFSVQVFTLAFHVVLLLGIGILKSLKKILNLISKEIQSFETILDNQQNEETLQALLHDVISQ